MEDRQIEIVTLENTPPVYGLWMESGDRTVSKDIKALSASYYEAAGQKPGAVLPFYVLSKDYDENSRRFRLFIGGEAEEKALEKFCLPAGLYAKLTVRPKLGFLWGPAIGEAKRYFYTEWLKAQPYVARNLEYEYHTTKSAEKHPEIDLYFAIVKNGD